MKYLIVLLLVFNLNIFILKAQHHQNEHEYLNLIKSTLVTNLTVLMGETILLNCSLKLNTKQNNENFLSETLLNTLNPTWLKADGKYDQSGEIIAFKSENIIVTRKGVIIDGLKEKIKLVGLNDKIQSLKIIDIIAKDEGKYICREFNSENDKIFYLKIYGMSFLPSKLYYFPVLPRPIREVLKFGYSVRQLVA